MNARIAGKAWKLGDNVDTDAMASGVYLKLPIAELAAHCLETVDPEFAGAVQPGDILVCGENFGLGSSREQAPQALKFLGVGAILAKSFARIFYRNAVNLGIPALFFPEADEVRAGDRLEINLAAGEVRNLDTGCAFRVEPMPAHLLAMLADGGLIGRLQRRLAEEAGT